MFSTVLKYNPHHGKGGRFATAPLSSLDKRLVDYKPDRSLSNPAEITAITKVLPSAKHVAYGKTPFLAKMHGMMGLPDPESVPVSEYMAARKKLFGAQPVSQLPLNALVVTQRNVNSGKIAHGVSAGPAAFGDMPIDAVKHKGKFYVMNGHHRAVSAALSGKPTLSARVLDLDGVKKFDIPAENSLDKFEFLKVLKFNPNHDELGKFTDAARATFMSVGAKWSAQKPRWNQMMASSVSDTALARSGLTRNPNSSSHGGLKSRAMDVVNRAIANPQQAEMVADHRARNKAAVSDLWKPSTDAVRAAATAARVAATQATTDAAAAARTTPSKVVPVKHGDTPPERKPLTLEEHKKGLEELGKHLSAHQRDTLLSQAEEIHMISGGKMDSHALMKGFVGDLGENLKSLNVSTDRYSGKVTFTFSGKVHGADLQGTGMRTIDFKKGDVHHDYLKVTEEDRGTGAVKKMYAAVLPEYHRMGLKTASVYANIDGGSYAWAKFGFRPTNPEGYARRAGTRLTNEIDKISRVRGEMSPQARDEYKAAMAVLTQMRDSDKVAGVFSDIKTPELDKYMRVGPGFSGDFMHHDYPQKYEKMSAIKMATFSNSWDGLLHLQDPATQAKLKAYTKPRG